MKTEIQPNFRAYDIAHFHIETLRIESAVLRSNPLRDPHVRFNPVLKPKEGRSWPVVLVLGGFTGNAPYYFNPKFNEQNTIQGIDQSFSRGEAPEALYVFVDAITAWGGSQFLNSAATGLYEDYIINEIVPTLKKEFPVSKDPANWCVTGGSSGGYGALHLGSKYPEIFGLIAAIAPDSFFEASLTSEILQALPLWDKYKQSGIKALEELRNGRLTKMKNWHTLLNVFGMASCYGAKGSHGDFELPLSVNTGEKIPELWQKWLQFDPIYFLPHRFTNLKKLSGIYLDVGNKDNFHLQFGARQISKLFQENNIPHDYVEFDGTHFDLAERRPEVWKWLSSIWRT